MAMGRHRPSRYKIDLNIWGIVYPYALYGRRWRWCGLSYWQHLRSFETQAEARAFYEEVKNLPEYLA